MYLETINNYNIPSLPFKSKSGGLHLYVFFAQPVLVKRARGYINRIRSLLGLNIKTEIFPKQETIVAGQIGNWINLPYYNYEETKQYLYKYDMTPYTLEEALKEIRSKIQTEETITEFFEGLPLNDAPPCLQSIYLKKYTDYRNEYLFSLAGYFKSKHGDDFEYKLAEANNDLLKPLPIEELTKTIISTHKKKDYTYKCSNDPIASLCDKDICKYREYGIGGDEINQLSYEDFIQYTTDPPYYEWIINGQSLKFYNEIDIIQQQKFRMLCFRKLHVLPNRLKEIKWTRIINNALENLIVKEITDLEDISPGALFKEYLTDFLEKRTLAKNKEQILVGRVFKDDKINCYVFKAKNLIDFLMNQKKFYYYGSTEIHDKLTVLGGYAKRYYINKNQGTKRVWLLPYDGLKEFVEDEPKKEELEIDFEEETKNEPF